MDVEGGGWRSAHQRRVTVSVVLLVRWGFGVVTAAIVMIGALALSLQFSVTRVPNFAHGELITYGGYGAFLAQAVTHNLLADLLSGMALGAAAAWASNRFVLQPFIRIGARPIYLLIVTAGLSLVLQNGLGFFAGFTTRLVQLPPSAADTYRIGPVLWTKTDIVVMAIALASVVVMYLLLQYTKFGKAQRAVADHPELAAVSGVNVPRIVAQTWLLTGLLAGLCGGYPHRNDRQYRADSWLHFSPPRLRRRDRWGNRQTLRCLSRRVNRRSRCRSFSSLYRLQPQIGRCDWHPDSGPAVSPERAVCIGTGGHLAAMVLYVVVVLTLVAIFSIVCIGLNIQWGLGGLVNLSAITFVAIGGYVSAVFTLPPSEPYMPHILGLQAPFLVGAVAAMVVCGVMGFALGVVALSRVRDYYFAIVTLCVGEITYEVVNAYPQLFNGFAGLYGVPQPFLTVIPGGQDYYSFFYLGFCVLILIAVFIFAEALRRSPFGRALRAVREDQKAASAFGLNVFRLQVKAFVLGSVIAGLGGALLVHFVGGYNPLDWTVAETFLLLACVFLGGSGNNAGVILGTFLVVGVFNEGTRFIPDVLISRSQLAALQAVVIGLLLIAILRWRASGILPEPLGRDKQLDWARWRFWRRFNSKSFDGVSVLRDVSLKIDGGQPIGLIGPNGAGKSTLIDIVTGFQKPTSGRVNCIGRDVTGWPPHAVARLGLARTFQLARVWSRLTVMENMLVAAAPPSRAQIWRALMPAAGWRADEAHDRLRAREVLAEFQLLDLKDAPAERLSGGQRRLLEFGRIVMARPGIVFLDEPSAGLSPVMVERISEAMKRLSAAGISIVLVEHNLPLVANTCERICVLAGGTLIAVGSMSELRQNDLVIEAYLGSALDARSRVG